ncbi:hypothetical protein PRUPE_2G172400 [Prunus persica]|uniref:Large ribosomal subunit protein uL11 N-terminal domain-containing protein n=1 Tax=Prunus persica TaxID=3760 RepID=M5X9E3_PRUPE|nr:hypothetical protein PRUPE_2G172400 [Prunus persica]
MAADGLPWSGFAPRPACAGHPQPFLEILTRRPVLANIRVTLPAGVATPKPLSKDLGQYRAVNMMAFCKDFNAQTQMFKLRRTRGGDPEQHLRVHGKVTVCQLVPEEGHQPRLRQQPTQTRGRF